MCFNFLFFYFRCKTRLSECCIYDRAKGAGLRTASALRSLSTLQSRLDGLFLFFFFFFFFSSTSVKFHTEIFLPLHGVQHFRKFLSSYSFAESCVGTMKRRRRDEVKKPKCQTCHCLSTPIFISGCSGVFVLFFSDISHAGHSAFLHQDIRYFHPF